MKNFSKELPSVEQTTNTPKLQMLPAFKESFAGGKIDSAGRYTEPTAERKAFLEQQLDQFGELMSEANFDYFLDGALNVSLLNKRFVRDHKDMDLSVMDDALELLDQHLKKHGYAMAYTHREKQTANERCLEIVSAKEIVERKLQHLSVVRVDHLGYIQDTHEMANFMDLHVHHRDAGGDVHINYSGVVIPQRYTKGSEPYHTKTGHNIPVSHPVVVAYHKVEHGRDYDFRDIAHLNSFLTEEDRNFLREVFRQEPERKMLKYTPFISKIYQQLDPAMRPEEIKKILEAHRVGRDPDGEAFIQVFPALYKNDPTMREEDFINLFSSQLKMREKFEKEAQKKIDKLEEAFLMKV